jgi:hypothetical protein
VTRCRAFSSCATRLKEHRYWKQIERTRLLNTTMGGGHGPSLEDVDVGAWRPLREQAGLGCLAPATSAGGEPARSTATGRLHCLHADGVGLRAGQRFRTAANRTTLYLGSPLA